MGERTENWPEKKLDALAGSFSHVAYKSTSEWKKEIVYFDPTGCFGQTILISREPSLVVADGARNRSRAWWF